MRFGVSLTALLAVAEQFGGDAQKLRGIERAIRAYEPFIAVEVRHVMRRQEHGVVARGVQMTVGSIDDTHLRHRHAALGVEIGDRELMAFGLRRSAIGSVLTK